LPPRRAGCCPTGQLSFHHHQLPRHLQPDQFDSGDIRVHPTDGTLGANTAIDGILGHLFRCKYSSSGVYGGTTSLAVDAVSGNRLEPW